VAAIGHQKAPDLTESQALVLVSARWPRDRLGPASPCLFGGTRRERAMRRQMPAIGLSSPACRTAAPARDLRRRAMTVRDRALESYMFSWLGTMRLLDKGCRSSCPGSPRIVPSTTRDSALRASTSSISSWYSSA